jgi:dGTPase
MTRTTERTLSQLLSATRIATGHLEDPAHLSGQHRSAFETDGDKISFTEGFRALADKTQVHDRVGSGGDMRNRLTHSMEVSRVGRSLGVALGARMISYYGLHAAPTGEAFWQVNPSDVGSIVAAACLAHDLGNPPFGHDGEDAISAYFRDTPDGQRAVAAAGPAVGAELCLHEGNAQGFRMITRSMGWREEGGLNLTAATLAAFGKYPFPLKKGGKKYGIHRADMATMEAAAEATGMIREGEGWRRHPLAWLMEAADDICYLTVDLEDAAWLGMVSFDNLCELYAPIIGDDEVMRGRRMDNQPRAIQYFRSRMVKTLISSSVEIYPDIAGQLDDGTLPKGAYGGGIVGHSRHAEQMEVIREFSRNEIYLAKVTKDARGGFRQAMNDALQSMVSDLLRWLDDDAAQINSTSEDYPALARLPQARLGTMIPREASAAFPWLLDQITLMSDAQTFDLGHLPR